MEYNTPVSGFGRRDWLNIDKWSSNDTEIRFFQIDNTTILSNTPFLEISYEGTAISGGCPAKKKIMKAVFLSDLTVLTVVHFPNRPQKHMIYLFPPKKSMAAGNSATAGLHGTLIKGIPAV